MTTKPDPMKIHDPRDYVDQQMTVGDRPNQDRTFIDVENGDTGERIVMELDAIGRAALIRRLQQANEYHRGVEDGIEAMRAALRAQPVYDETRDSNGRLISRTLRA